MTIRHSIYVVAVLAGISTPAFAQQQITPPPPIVVNTPIVTINNSPGNQTDPHVSKDVATYTDLADLAVRYYTFSTNVDSPIPKSPGEQDTLAAVSGNRVCFAHSTSTGDFEIGLFDVTTMAVTLIDPHPGDLRMGCAIGGNTLVYGDFGTTNGNGDMFFVDLAATSPAPPQALSLSPGVEGSPNVSPDGNAVVWENCPTPSNCDIWKAVRSGGPWATSTVIDTPGFEENPDTDGTWITYDSNQGSTTWHVYFVPLAGGQVTQLALGGTQVNPSISKGFIGFESTTPTTSRPDIYVYDIAQNFLYQVTSTPLVDEQLNNISVLDNGDVRVIWAATDVSDPYTQNIYSTTFTPFPHPNSCSSSVLLSPISLFGGDAAGLALDLQGNLFVAENVHPFIPGGPRVTKVTPLGTKTTVVPQGQLGDVTALAVDHAGNLYIADGNGIGNGQPFPVNKVWKRDSQGNLTEFVSSVNNPTGLSIQYVGGPAVQAAAFPNFFVYVASFTDRAVYKYSYSGAFLGTVASGLPFAPYGIAFDSQGNLYIAGFGAPANGTSIYKVTPTGDESVFFDAAPLTSPASLVFDSQDNLYASYYNGLKIVRIAPDGTSVVLPGGCIGDDAVNGLALGDDLFVYAAVNGGRTTAQPAVLKLQGMVPPTPDCHARLVSTYTQRYGGLSKAAVELGFKSVQGLQDYIRGSCGN